MIRFRRLTPALLDAWLVEQRIPGAHATYRIRLWRENRAAWAAIQREVIAYVEEAFEDARRRLRRGFEDSLSPFHDPANDPAAHYPGALHRATLQGYLGEILAVLAVEHWGAHGHTDWTVPAFLFRLHDAEFQHLDQINERLAAGEAHHPDEDREVRPGRSGDDALAFRMNGDDAITDVLALEAKCLTCHSARKVEEAHQKLAAGGLRPPGIRELVALLSEYDTPQAEVWRVALLRLWRGDYRHAGRHDGVAYACAQIPVRPPRMAWMPTNAPHAAYTAAARRLEAMEFQFDDLVAPVDVLFRRT
ncbi:MAG: hypothetical protein JXP73_11815 [Deltaproteobacteria bacterium]|nr:hypothetical protein [Deltaproteobacteria bacterium]